MQSPYWIDEIHRESMGTTVHTLTIVRANSTLIPIPPLAEQRRIVEKVDQLLGLCDELAARQAAQREKRQRLVGATLDRLVSCRQMGENVREGEAPAEPQATRISGQTARQEPRPPGMQSDFEIHAHRLRNHFDQLFDTPTTIPQLRQTILQLAVQGYLVPHDRSDEPASLLLERIVIEKAKLVGEKKVREPKTRSEDGEPPFAVPNNWVWGQAEDVCKPADVITYGVLKPEWVIDGVPTVRVQDMKNGDIVVGQIGQCSPARADKFSKTTLEEGDLLIAKDGATLGKTAFVPPSLVGGNVTQHVLRFPISPHVWRWYIRLVVDSPLGQAWMRKETRGVALPGVNVEDFRRMPIPLPPFAEQKRIVTKVTELLSLCDALEAKLTQAESASTQLLSAAVHQLLNGAVANV
jgi:type I restriction enzyme S subunit